MERGVAHINFGIAQIETDKSPQPVAFKMSMFEDVMDGDEVLFTRSDSNPEWATKVVPARRANELASMATPAGGLTSGAETLLVDQAARLVAQALAAPTKEQADEHLKFARHLMTRIAKQGSTLPGPLNVQQVRSMFKRDAPRA